MVAERELFVSSINCILTQMQEEDKLMDVLNGFIDGHAVASFSTNVIRKVIDLLSFIMDDSDNWIDWWLFESVEKHANYNGKEYALSTAYDLYNFMDTLRKDAK